MEAKILQNQKENNNVDIFVYSHKPFTPIVKNHVYKVLTNSHAESKEFNTDLAIYRDYDGDNISDKNDSGFFIDNRNNYTIEQKIHNIFNSPNYIYKIDVVIVTDKGKENKRIVGKTKTNLITMDNEYIPINTIRDIYILK